jgi:hypothetical protein
MPLCQGKMTGRRFACPERVKNVNQTILKRLGALLSVKSIVTLILTGVFAYLSVSGQINQDFMTIYAVIIAFYFGTQSQKVQDVMDGESSGNNSK